MKLSLSTVISCSCEKAAEQVLSSRLLRYVAHPLVSFSPVGADPMPDVWTEGTHWVRLRLFGLLPLGKQAIVISILPVTRGFALRDAGHSALIPVWDHRLTIEPLSEGALYTDVLEIRAGVLTPLIWLFAHVFFRHRQRRWRALADSCFDYSAGWGDPVS